MADHGDVIALQGLHTPVYGPSTSDPAGTYTIREGAWWMDSTTTPHTLKRRAAGAWVAVYGPQLVPDHDHTGDAGDGDTLAITITAREVDANPTVAASVIEFPNGTLTDQGGGVARYTPGAGGNTLVVKELDGSPTGAFDTLKLPNGTLTDNGDGSATYTPTSGGLYTAEVLVQDQKTSGTAGGTATSGAWRTRDLNTEVVDTGSDASVGSNQITLAAGTWDVEAWALSFRIDNNKIRIQNITDGTPLVQGINAYSASTADYAYSPARLEGTFTIAGSKVIELQHNPQTTKATTGWGGAVSQGTEIYSSVWLRKRA